MIDNGEKTWKIFPAPLDLLCLFGYNTHMENNTTMNSNFDDNFKIDLPGEVEDLHDENTEWERVILQLEDQDRWDDDDPDVLLPDDDSEPDIFWNDADSLTSIGWGEDEAYSLFDDGGEW